MLSSRMPTMPCSSHVIMARETAIHHSVHRHCLVTNCSMYRYEQSHFVPQPVGPYDTQLRNRMTKTPAAFMPRKPDAQVPGPFYRFPSVMTVFGSNHMPAVAFNANSHDHCSNMPHCRMQLKYPHNLLTGQMVAGNMFRPNWNPVRFGNMHPGTQSSRPKLCFPEHLKTCLHNQRFASRPVHVSESGYQPAGYQNKNTAVVKGDPSQSGPSRQNMERCFETPFKQCKLVNIGRRQKEKRGSRCHDDVKQSLAGLIRKRQRQEDERTVFHRDVHGKHAVEIDHSYGMKPRVHAPSNRTVLDTAKEI